MIRTSYDSCAVLDNLVKDGARTGPAGNVLTLFHSLSESQRELMDVDLDDVVDSARIVDPPAPTV